MNQSQVEILWKTRMNRIPMWDRGQDDDSQDAKFRAHQY